MRCFKATQKMVTPYLTLISTPYPHIGIGEEGRGRKYTRFPVGQRFADQLTPEGPCPRALPGGSGSRMSPGTCPDCGVEYYERNGWYYHPSEGMCKPKEASIERASILKTREKGTLLLVEERDPKDRRALVHLAVEAGFRGSAQYTSTEYALIPCPKREKTLSPFSACGVPEGGRIICETCGITLSKVPQDTYNHPDEGDVRVYEALDNTTGVTILAEGRCAQGEAGRMGGHPEYLVIMEPGTTIRVQRTGRLYGAPAILYIHWDGEELRLGEYDEIFPPSCETEEGELI